MFKKNFQSNSFRLLCFMFCYCGQLSHYYLTSPTSSSGLFPQKMGKPWGRGCHQSRSLDMLTTKG